MLSSFFLFLVFFYIIGMSRDIKQSSGELRLEWSSLTHVPTPGDSTFTSGDEDGSLALPFSWASNGSVSNFVGRLAHTRDPAGRACFVPATIKMAAE
uniref:Putative secreted protein n=1 Tax=Ixodes ricinus TaxID=34613 RepID=A0A6B0UDQ3_IXORI